MFYSAEGVAGQLPSARNVAQSELQHWNDLISLLGGRVNTLSLHSEHAFAVLLNEGFGRIIAEVLQANEQLKKVKVFIQGDNYEKRLSYIKFTAAAGEGQPLKPDFGVETAKFFAAVDAVVHDIHGSAKNFELYFKRTHKLDLRILSPIDIYLHSIAAMRRKLPFRREIIGEVLKNIPTSRNIKRFDIFHLLN